MKPDRAPQIYAEVASPANRCHTPGEWELPEGAVAKLIREEATIRSPTDVAARARRNFARSFRSEEEPDRGGPLRSGRREMSALPICS